MIGRPPVAPRPWVGRSSRRGQSRPSCRRREPARGQDCQLQTAYALPGRRGEEEEEEKPCLKESLFCALKEHSSCHDIHHLHLPGTEEEDPVVEAGTPAGSPTDPRRRRRADLSCQEVARSHSHNPRLRPRQLEAGQAHPQHRQGCRDQGEVAGLNRDDDEDADTDED